MQKENDFLNYTTLGGFKNCKIKQKMEIIRRFLSA